MSQSKYFVSDSKVEKCHLVYSNEMNIQMSIQAQSLYRLKNFTVFTAIQV